MKVYKIIVKDDEEISSEEWKKLVEKLYDNYKDDGYNFGDFEVTWEEEHMERSGISDREYSQEISIDIDDVPEAICDEYNWHDYDGIVNGYDKYAVNLICHYLKLKNIPITRENVLKILDLNISEGKEFEKWMEKEVVNTQWAVERANDVFIDEYYDTYR